MARRCTTAAGRPIFVHPSVAPINAAYRAVGVHLPETRVLDAQLDRRQLGRALLLVPPAAGPGGWAQQLGAAAGRAQRRVRQRLDAASGRAPPTRLPQQPAQRLKSTSLSKKLLADSPAVFMAFDLLVFDGADIRGQALHQRRSRLQRMLSPLARGALQCAPTLVASDWGALEKQRALAREQGKAGLVLKPLASRYTDSVAAV